MNKKIKQLLLIMLVIALLIPSTIVNTYASNTTAEPSFMNDIKNSLYSQYRQFTSIDDVKNHLSKYGNMFEEKDDNDNFSLNYVRYMNASQVIYGGIENVPSSDQRLTNGQYMILGYDFFGRYYTNMMHPETNMINPRMVTDPAGTPSPNLSNPQLRPFKSYWNDPEYVGERLLGFDATLEDKLAVGNIMIDMWMEHIINRIPELYPNGTGTTSRDPATNNGTRFLERLSVEEMKTISWGTHRTFLI